ncbi:uncharacterized protein TNCV_3029091 [Trichonephila clavipes]|nr:uncharacterized protein TNCV_3029091 [Trichonephila clavipes]
MQSGRVAAVAEWYRYRNVACLVTSSSPVPLKTRRVGQRCTLNLSRAETSSRRCGVVVRRGVPVQINQAVWTRKLSIAPATNDEYAATSAELGNIHTSLLAVKERMNFPLFRLSKSIETLDALIKKWKINAPSNSCGLYSKRNSFT